MISIRHNLTEQYTQYGLSHFIFKYGIIADINQVENPDSENLGRQDISV